MEDLPVELIETILSSSKLKMKDLVNFGLTCSHFRQIVNNSNYLWREKFKAQWPHFMCLFSKDFIKWYDEICYIFNLKKRTRELLTIMSVKCYKKVELSDSDYENWIKLIQENSRTYHYLVSDLMEIINTSVLIKSIKVVPLDIPGNNTLKYYAHKVLRYLRQVHLTKMWKEYIRQPQQKHILEIGSIIIAQWCQPDVDVGSEVAKRLNDLTEEVKAYTRITYPNHMLNNALKETLDFWKDNRLEKCAWSSIECKQLIKCIAHILYAENKFCGSREEFQASESIFINKVLNNKVGVPIALAVIYQAIARRVGLKCDIVILPAHSLVRCMEGDGKTITDSYYIDTLRDGNIIKKGGCPFSRNNMNISDKFTPPATFNMVFQSMIETLEFTYRHHAEPQDNVLRLRSILELSHMIIPFSAPTIANLFRLYTLYNIDTGPLIVSIHSNVEVYPDVTLQDIINSVQPIEKRSNYEELMVTTKTRTENVKYAVGMIMKHFVLGYTCVIFNWDQCCMASVEWQLQMGVHKLRHRHAQPFYHVIVEDGSQRYAAQENIIPATPTKPMENERLGKYFSHYFENHFVPNAELEKQYPSDAEVRFKFYQKLKNLV